MALSMEQLRAAFKKDETSGSSSKGNIYPFWRMNVDETCTIRLLPDLDEDNPRGFVVFKDQHILQINGKTRYVPCTGFNDCPMCAVSQAYYQDDDEKMGKKFWRSRKYLIQAQIVKDPLASDGDSAKGKVKVIPLSFEIFGIIKEAIESGDLESPPYDYENGTDLVIKKTKKGKRPSYNIGTKFLRKEREIDEDTIDELEEDMVELSSLLDEPMAPEKVQALLEAALTGGDLDEDDDDDEDDEDEPVRKPKKRKAKTLDLDDEPVRKPKKKKAPVVEEDVYEEEDDYEEEEEEEVKKPARKPKKRKAPVVEEDDDEEDDDEDEDDDIAALMKTVRNRNKK